MNIKLPPEIILNVLDQLVGISSEREPIFDPSNPITKTLRALTLTSRSTYPVASRYLYRHCLYLRDCVSYACFRRTLGLDLGSNHPQALPFGQDSRNEELWKIAKPDQYITTAFISPMEMPTPVTKHTQHTPMVRIPQIVDLCNLIGPTLKRLLLDMQPVYTPRSEVEHLRLSHRETNIFLNMPNLEELVTSYDIQDYFRLPPPNLKRLAITVQELTELFLTFCFATSTLQRLVILRPPELSAADINSLFAGYTGQSLDVVFVDVNSNHRTPDNTRDWRESDVVRIWEVDVPTSFYGDDDDLILCDSWIWTRAVEGSLWDQQGRRMVSWSEIQRRLVGPVHQIVENY